MSSNAATTTAAATTTTTTTTTTGKRPDRTTMNGMIWNANHVLTKALDPKTNGVPRTFFDRDLKGILLLSTIEAGFIFSGNVGTGILMARDGEGKWSPPCAVGLAGVGWGFILGASIKDIMVFVFDDVTMLALAGDAGLKFGGQGELTLGPIGRNADITITASNKGIGSTVSIAFSKGLFGGISLEGAVVGSRSAVNAKYYGKDCTPLQILYDETVQIPEGSLLPQVYEKLDKLIHGTTHETSAEELAAVEVARQAADMAAQEANNAPDIVHVDAKVEAEKEAAASLSK